MRRLGRELTGRLGDLTFLQSPGKFQLMMPMPYSLKTRFPVAGSLEIRRRSYFMGWEAAPEPIMWFGLERGFMGLVFASSE